jgi:hypothetical protein
MNKQILKRRRQKKSFMRIFGQIGLSNKTKWNMQSSFLEECLIFFKINMEYHQNKLLVSMMQRTVDHPL